MLLPALTDGRIIKRYRRFLADIELADGRLITAHCPNTGSMVSCWEPGAPVQVSYSDNPKRKLRWTLERVDMGRGWVGVHTGRVNQVIAAGIRKGQIGCLDSGAQVRQEPTFDADGFPRSRFDLLLTDHGGRRVYMEIKNTTLLCADTVRFPDAVSVRGRKHLELLGVAVARGCRGVMVFAINRPEGRWFEPAWDIDPEYAHTLETVAARGVEVLAVRLRHDPQSIEVAGYTRYVA